MRTLRQFFVDTDGRKVFAAINREGLVDFTVSAANSKEAREKVYLHRHYTEGGQTIRLLRWDDMPSREREFAEHRGGGTPTFMT